MGGRGEQSRPRSAAATGAADGAESAWPVARRRQRQTRRWSCSGYAVRSVASAPPVRAADRGSLAWAGDDAATAQEMAATLQRYAGGSPRIKACWEALQGKLRGVLNRSRNSEPEVAPGVREQATPEQDDLPALREQYAAQKRALASARHKLAATRQQQVELGSKRFDLHGLQDLQMAELREQCADLDSYAGGSAAKAGCRAQAAPSGYPARHPRRCKRPPTPTTRRAQS